jgi:SAM-dependent methyltransferase
MGRVSDYLAVNRANWDERAPAHADSPSYEVERFVTDPSFLSGVVRFDQAELGNIAGARGVHLQCHIGTDTLSLARMGAVMTGVDFSPASLTEARRLAHRTGTAVDYVESDVYEALAVLEPGSFDLVYTGIGALCWLPDIAKWASVVAGLLRPGGRLFMREGHPMLWTIDETRTDRIAVEYPYFEQQQPLVYEDGGTYVDTDVTFAHNVSHTWNHGLGQVVSALGDAGMALFNLAEHDSVPWEALPGQMVKDDSGEWRLADRPGRLAASYTLQAVRR